jgi:hypothetical protein
MDNEDSTVFMTACHRTSISFIPILKLSYHQQLGLLSGCFPSCLQTKILHVFLISSMCACWPTHLILLDLITLIFGLQYNLWRFSMFSSFVKCDHEPYLSTSHPCNLRSFVIPHLLLSPPHGCFPQGSSLPCHFPYSWYLIEHLKVKSENNYSTASPCFRSFWIRNITWYF